MFYRFWKTKQDLSVPALADKVVLKGKKKILEILVSHECLPEDVGSGSSNICAQKSVTDDPSIPANITYTNVLLRGV